MNADQQKSNAEQDGGGDGDGYNFFEQFDVSESIPEDNEDYSSTDCTYHSEELEVVYNEHEFKEDTNHDSFENDDDFFMEQNEEDEAPLKNSFRTSGSSVDDIGVSGSYRTSGSPILDSSDFDNASFRRSQEEYEDNDGGGDDDGEYDRNNGRSDTDDDDDDDSSYTENDDDDDESYRSQERKENSVHLSPSFSFRSLDSKSSDGGGFSSKLLKHSEASPEIQTNMHKTTELSRSHQSKSQKRLVTDCEASVDSNHDQNDISSFSHSSTRSTGSSSEEENVSLSNHKKASLVGGSHNSFQFSEEWASFSNLKERQPNIVGGAKTFDSAVDTPRDKNANSTNSPDPLTTTGFESDPFGGDPFAKEAPQTVPITKSSSFQNSSTQDHSEFSGTDNTAVCGIYPFETFASSSGNFSGIQHDVESDIDDDKDPNSHFLGEDYTKTIKDDANLVEKGDEDQDFGRFESNDSFSENSPQSGGFDDDNRKARNSEKNEKKKSGKTSESSSSSSNTTEDSDNAMEPVLHHEPTNDSNFPSFPSIDQSEDFVSFGFEKEQPIPFENENKITIGWDNEKEESYKSSDEEPRSSRHENNNSDHYSMGDIPRDGHDSSSTYYSNAESTKFLNIKDKPWQNKEESISSHLEKVDFGENSNQNNSSDSDSLSRDNDTSSTTLDEKATKPYNRKDERSWSSHEEAVNEAPSSEEHFKFNRLVEDGNKLFHTSFGNSNEKFDSKNGSHVTDESLNSTFENDGDRSSTLKSSDNQADESDNSEAKSFHDEAEEEGESRISTSASSGYSEFRSFEDDADSSWNSNFDPSKRSGTDSSFHDSDLSKSLRFEAEEGFNPADGNSDDSRINSLEEDTEESVHTSEEEVEVSQLHQDSSFFDDSEFSTSVSRKGETNESVSASGFDSSEFSRSLGIDVIESFNPGYESSERYYGQLSTSEHENPDMCNSNFSKESSKDLESGSEPIREETDELRSRSVDSSDHQSYTSLQHEGRKSEPNKDEAHESHYSSSSFDSHQDFRSRSLNKRTVDESFNSAFDVSRSDFDLSTRKSTSLDDQSNESSHYGFHSSEGSISKPISKLIEKEPNQLLVASSESGASEDQSNDSLPRQELQLSNTGGAKNDKSSDSLASNNTKDAELGTEENQDSFTGNAKQQQQLEKNHNHNSNEAGNDSEVSMMIGDVFGQPNELFEDFNKPDRSSKSAGLISHYILQKKEQNNLIISEAQDEDDSDDHHSEAPQNENELNITTKRNKGTKVISEKERRKMKRRRKERNRRKKEAKSPALLDFAANVNDAILDLEDRSESQQNTDSPAYSLLHGFDALLGIFLQLSDEVELIATFSALKKKDEASVIQVSALTAILDFADTFDQLFSDLKPIIFDCFEEADEYMDELFERLDALVDLVCETTHRVGERQEWSCRAETTYVTLLELIERDSLDLRCYFDDIDTPDPGISANVREAWSATGHIEELKALQRNNDPLIFRQICYEVMVSTDQWCPDRDTLMEICDIDPDILKEESPQEHINEDEIAPIPQAAEHILDKVNGETLRRVDAFASVLQRILPPHAVTDPHLRPHFASIRNSVDSQLGLSTTSVVSISSVPESINDPDALGVAGVGKTTLAAMVAEHRDVRQHFIDGVAWIYLGDEKLNYNRYTQCLRELVAQLDFYDGIPLFAELLHTPGEDSSKRKRREEGFMIYARDTIAGLLEDRSVLIILDDICFEPDMDWFDFAPMPDESTDSQNDNCALLITTRRRFLLPAADTVEIDMLDEADAITLLIQESGQLSRTLMAESKEARSVVRECANHPLAVKSIGRWLNLKHATAGVVSSVEEIHSEVIKSMDKILKAGDNTGTDMMYEILSTSLSPAINGGPTNIIKFCFAAFVMVFCDRNHISEFELTEPTPIIPMDIAELLFQTLLEMYEVSLLKKGSLFYAQKKEAAVLIPEALSALGVLKVITYSDIEEKANTDDEQKFLQVMHSIHHEYGVYLATSDISLKDFTKDAERQWNRALVDAYLSRIREWDWDLDDAAHGYALEMIVSHMIRGTMYNAAVNLLTERSFIRGRLKSLGRENCTNRYIKDCELLFKKLKQRVPQGSKLRARSVMKRAYNALGKELTINVEKNTQDARVKNVEVARARYEIGFSLAEHRCWDAAVTHWETSQELLMLALGPVEVVAGISYNIGVVYSELHEYEQALNCLKQCLKIRATAHGEEHVLYAQTIQKIGDVLLDMSDYHEATESYNWALDVMYREPDHHYIEIGEILDNKGTIHYSKGEVDEALQCHQEALRSKQQDLGEDHPELAETYRHIGNCLSDQGNIDDAIVHFEEAVRLKELHSDGGPENDADVLTIEGILNNLEGNQKQGLECYERALQILVTKVPHRKEKVASVLHLIGCVYLMSGEQTKAMKLFKETLKARRKVLGFIHLDVASTLFNMAFLHQTRNHLDKALRCLEEALKIRQLRLPESEKVAVTHEKIGSLARGMGKAKKAQIAFEEALKIRKSIHGHQHEAVATVLQELGDLMDDLGDYESAMGFYIDALEIRRSRLGPDDIAVAETLYSMGYTLHNSEESERALACFVEALSIRRYQIGEDSMEVGDTLNMMGFLRAKRGEQDDALTLLWDALRIRKLQEDHIKVSETLRNIGNVHREKDELDLALECYEESLRIRITELGHDHEKVADVLVAMGDVYSENPLTTQEAKRSYQGAMEIRERVFGNHDESVAMVLKYLGAIEYRLNNHDYACDLLQKYVKIRRDNGTHNDGDYVNVLVMIGNIYKEKGNEKEAKVCWNESYQVFQERGLAETNPKIAAAMEHLVEEDKIDKHLYNKVSLSSETNKTKSLFGMVSEMLVKKDKSDDDSLYQSGRKNIRRLKGKGFKL